MHQATRTYSCQSTPLSARKGLYSLWEGLARCARHGKRFRLASSDGVGPCEVWRGDRLCSEMSSLRECLFGAIEHSRPVRCSTSSASCSHAHAQNHVMLARPGHLGSGMLRVKGDLTPEGGVILASPTFLKWPIVCPFNFGKHACTDPLTYERSPGSSCGAEER